MFGQLCQPRRLVYGVADHGVFETLLSPNVAGYDRAGGDPDARRKVGQLGNQPVS
jgi:hypothetical protein